MSTFIDDCITGKAAPDDIDNYIGTWHCMPWMEHTPQLHEFLGLTADEYARFVKLPADINNIVQEYLQRLHK